MGAAYKDVDGIGESQGALALAWHALFGLQPLVRPSVIPWPQHQDDIHKDHTHNYCRRPNMSKPTLLQFMKAVWSEF